MKEESFNNLLLIWMLRHLDISRAKHDIYEYYEQLEENKTLEKMSKSELTISLLTILEKYEIPYSNNCNCSDCCFDTNPFCHKRKFDFE